MDRERIAIVTDSSCDLPEEYVARQEDLYILPLQLVYPEGTYSCGVDITPDEVYRRMEQGEVPTTALPAPEDVEDVFRRIEERGIRRVLFVMISSGLSGTYNMVRLLCEHQTKMQTIVYDSKFLSMGLGYLVEDAVALVEKGTPFHELTARLNQKRAKIDGFFYLNTLEYLIKGGRIGLVAGAVGKLLNIKPIIGVNEEGKYYPRAACIGEKKIVRQASRLVADFVGNHAFDLTVMSGNAFDKARTLMEEILKLSRACSARILPLGPALAVHTGPGMLAVLIRLRD